jgi:hypothetical protein
MSTRPAILAILLTAPLMAGDPWSTQDKALECAFVAAMVVDYRQTSEIHHWDHVCNASGYHYETNCVMGRYPKQATINRYFVVSTALQIVVVHLLPSGKWRTMAQAFTLGIEAGAIGHNYSIGLKFKL